MKNSNWIYLLIFLACYALLNSSLYITDYWLHKDFEGFWPKNNLILEDSTLISLDPLVADPIKLALQAQQQEEPSEAALSLPSSFWMRNGHDIFRANAELWLWVFALLLLAKWPKAQKWVKWIGFLGFVFLLIYHAYYFIMVSLYAKHPFIPNDLVLAYEVLPIFLGQITFGSSLVYILFVLGFILVVGTLTIIVGQLCRSSQKLGKAAYWTACAIMALGGILILYSSMTPYADQYQKYKEDYLSFQWIYPRIKKSLVAEGIHKTVNRVRALPYSQYMDYELTQKPDVYFLCVESYGQVLTADPQFKDQFYPMLSRTDSLIKQSGWYTASAYSLSPIAGGGSWLAFTTAMTGLKIENQLRFKDLVSIDFPYPHMVNFFNGQGYSSIRLKTMQKTSASTDSSYKVINDFYNFDHWLKFHHFPYRGYMYNYFGGIPDQFALNYHQETIVNANPRPVFTFFISMVSHGPWFLPPPILPDWQKLNDITSNPDPRAPANAIVWKRYEDLLPGTMQERYPETIDHELQVLTDFILNRIDENSIVILLGDHQPGLITNYDAYGLETILHIISKDRGFIERFWEEGLGQGMMIRPGLTHAMKHEGFYSLFMRNFLKQYAGVEDRLDYFPDGI